MRRRRSVSDLELDYYRSHFLEAIREDGVVCLECGVLLLALARHITRHGMTLDDYKEKWGYNKGRGLVAPSVSSVLRGHALARNLGGHYSPELTRKALESNRGRPRPVRLEARLIRRAVTQNRSAAGWRLPPRPKKVDDDTMRALVAEGLSKRQIANRTGAHPVTVSRRLRALGLERPVEPRVTEAELLAFCRAGLWQGEIAARTGLGVKAVNKRLWRLRRRGITIPRPTGPVPSGRRQVGDDQLLALAREGLGATEIAGRVALHPSNVWRRLNGLRRRGLLAPRQSLETRQDIDARILALCQAGVSNREIATRTDLTLGVARNQIRRLRQQGIIVPGRSAWPPKPRPRVTEEELIPLVQAGFRWADIAAQLGISRSQVAVRLRRLRRLGLLPPSSHSRPPTKSHDAFPQLRADR
jgi:transposase